ncbi:MAG: 2'-5' RNA ligase family protein [Candidatus Hodarchaeota archaeon]
MPYSIELHFNDRTTHHIQRIVNRLEKNGIRSITTEYNVPPHLTLIVYNTLDINDAREKLNLVGDQYRSFDLNLGVLGIGLKERSDFPNEPPLFFLPEVTSELLTIHRNVCELFEPYRKEVLWESYLPQNWLPHCTVAFNVPTKKIPDAMDTILNSIQSLTIRIDKMVLIEFFPYIVLHRKQLCD